MKSSPIYNFVHVPDRATNKDFGAGNQGFTQTVRVGTSSRNSHTFANISVTRELFEDGRVQFKLFIDGELIKRGILDGCEFGLAKI